MRTEYTIIVDWGTSILRAWLLTADSSVVESLHSEQGISVVNTDHEQVLEAFVSPWVERYGKLLVIAFGMVTSRNGWYEVPYVNCPANAQSLAAGIIKKRTANGLTVYLLPGVSDQAMQPFADVMRGEETQIIGFSEFANGVVVLPGTHSKWVRVQNASIEKFQTYITGELFGLLTQHGFIVSSDSTTQTINESVFELGIKTAKNYQPAANNMLSQLFSVRTGVLAGKLNTSDTNEYLSGLLLGQEFIQAASADWFKPGDCIGIVGNDTLTARYAYCAKLFDLSVHVAPEHVRWTGAASIARSFLETQK